MPCRVRKEACHIEGQQPGRIKVPRQRLWLLARGTWAIILINVVWFMLVEARNGFSDSGFVQSGTLYQPGIAEGQWYRLVSAMFVHLGLTHLLLNMVSLASLYIIELLFRTRAFLLLYFLSGVVGNLCVLWFTADNAAGASGAIFGVFGAALVLSFQGVLSKVARNQLLILLAANLIYGFSTAAVANAGHIGGLITGMLFTLVIRKLWRYPRGLQIAAAMCVMVTGVSLALALHA